MTIKIAVVVPGRFDAFDLTRELIRQGNDVVLLTNYPKFKVAEFDIPATCVCSFWLHGILSRVISRINNLLGANALEAFLHSWFSRWAMGQLDGKAFDVVYCYSGVAEELFHFLSKATSSNFLVRGSTHIRYQNKLLEEEEKRSGMPVDKPSSWMIAREEREYQLADKIVTLSSFAHRSFIDQGFNPQRLTILPLGAELDLFKPNQETIMARVDRITAREPLHVLMVGTFSLRKGAIDFIKIASELQSDFSFRFVGAISTDTLPIVDKARTYIEFMGKHPQHYLPNFYKWADVFIFTTIEDGYAVVLAQAQASGIPIIATAHSAAPDIIEEGKNGWIVPIRSPKKIEERLQWCHEHRQELADMSEHIYRNFRSRDWSAMAQELTEKVSEQKVVEKKATEKKVTEQIKV